MNKPGGYDANFIEDIPDYLKCLICQMVLKDPISLMECGHRFCCSCFQNLKERSSRRNKDLLCPTDKMKIDGDKVLDDEGIAKAVLGLKVKCSLALSGCPWTGKLVDLQKHVDYECSITEQEMTSTLLLRLEKRMQSYEKQLEEKDKRMKSYEKQLEEKDWRLTRCEKLLKLNAEELASMRDRLDQKDKQICMLRKHRDRLDQKDKQISMLRKQCNQSGAQHPSDSTSVAQSTTDEVMPPEKKKQRTSIYAGEAGFIKALSTWNEKRTVSKKSKYLDSICRNQEEQLLIKWLDTQEDLWNFQCGTGMNILHKAANQGCADVVNYICSTKRIDINGQSGGGWTPLHYAVNNMKGNCVQALIGHGCHVNVRYANKSTTLDLAYERHFYEIAELLETVGAKTGTMLLLDDASKNMTCNTRYPIDIRS